MPYESPIDSKLIPKQHLKIKQKTFNESTLHGLTKSLPEWVRVLSKN